MRLFPKTQKLIKISLASALVSLLLLPAVHAQDFTQGYSSDETLLRGSVVGVVPDETNKVQAITADQEEQLLGVVVRSTDSALTVTDDRTGVFVATSGRFEVLVSDVNGPINSGDHIAVSSIEGIGAKANRDAQFVLGAALQGIDFTNSERILSQATVTGADGNPVTVNIARIIAEIDVGPNPNRPANQQAPDSLIRFSEAVAGKPVSALKIYAGLAIILIASGISGSLLYSAVKSSIISIGRNPLSKRSVLTGLAQVVVVSTIIFVSGLVAVYLILKI